MSSKPGRVIRFSSSADDGDSKVVRIREKILIAQSLDPAKIILGQQVHGTAIAKVTSLNPSFYLETDGFITDRPGIALGVFSADCAPVFLSSADGKVAGILHSGRKGTLDNILPKALALLSSEWGVSAAETVIHLGPHIRKCCYEMSISEMLWGQARAHGVPAAQMSEDSRCTSCSKGFFSYRRTKTAERMLSYILIP